MPDIPIVNRNFLGDYLSAVSPIAYTLMGAGVVQVDENPNAKIDKTPFINNASATGTITGYERVFPFDAQMRTGEAATMLLVDIGRNTKTGTDAELLYVRADLYREAVGGAYPARSFRVTAEVSSIEGMGGEILRIKGNLHQFGDAIEGDLNPSTLAFTPDA